MCKPWHQGTQAEGPGPAALCSLSLGCFRKKQEGGLTLFGDNFMSRMGEGTWRGRRWCCRFVRPSGVPQPASGAGTPGWQGAGPMSLVPAPRKLPGLALLGVGSPAWQPCFQTRAQPSHFSLGSGVSPPSLLGTGWGAGR